MFKPAEIFIGLRYSVARRTNHFISFNSLISMLGIAIGVTALITVLSVMNGFEKELRERILGVVSHVTIHHEPDGLPDWSAMVNQLDQREGIAGAAPFIDRQAMLSKSGNVAGSQIRGIDPTFEPAVSTIDRHMIAGDLAALQPGKYSIILGSELAYSLGVKQGDSIMLVSPQTTITAVGILPRLKRFTVVGIFKMDMRDYDNGLALIHISDAGRLFRMEDRVSGIRLRLDDLFKAQAVSNDLLQTLPFGFQVGNWTRQHANFFRAVKMEKTVMFAILILIIAVAAFNLVSTLVIMVADKQSDIAILRTLGFSPGRVMRVFIIQGAFIGLLGTGLGLLGGVSLAQNIDTIVPAVENLLGFHFLSADVYYITELPSDMRWSDVLRIAIVSFLLCLLATLYPAWRAARTQPAEALRYE